MSIRNILHISDLHCTAKHVKSPKDSGGFVWDKALAEQSAKHLRKKFADNGVPNDGRADMILVTGDFVHQCRPAFDAAHEFIAAFVDVFSDRGREADVVLCPGNHDYKRELEEVGNHLHARAGYVAFATEWHEKVLSRASTNRAICEDLDVDLRDKWQPFSGAQLISPLDRSFGPVLTIDSTWQHMSRRSDAASLGDAIHWPKSWTNDKSQRQLLFQVIANKLASVSSSFPTLVLTHYPVWVSNFVRTLRTTSLKENEHVSSDFAELIRLIVSATGRPVLVFSGDIHEPDEDEIHFVTQVPSWAKQFVSGRCYLQLGESPQVPWRACARMVAIRNNGVAKDDVRSVLLKYGDDSVQEFNPSVDCWHLHSRSQQIPPDWVAQARVVESHHSVADEVAHDGEQSREERGNSENQDGGCNELELFVLQNRPVELMRVKCWGDKPLNRLMQIRVGPIMNHMEAREYSIRKLVEKLADWICPEKETLLIGLDCWGHAIASRLGFELGLKSIGLSVRGLTDEEFSIELKRRGLESAHSGGSGQRQYCYVTDVIATGDTVQRVKRAIEQNAAAKHLCLSLIRSGFSHTHSSLNGIESFSVLDEFPIPILRDEELPSEKILPAKSFGLR